jgi:hypothetical protein
MNFAKRGDWVAVSNLLPNNGKINVWFWLMSGDESVDSARLITQVETPYYGDIGDFDYSKLRFINDNYVLVYSGPSQELFIVKNNGQEAQASLPNGDTACHFEEGVPNKIYALSDKIIIIVYYESHIYLTDSLLNPTSFYEGPDLALPEPRYNFIQAKFKYGKVIIMQNQRILYSSDGLAWKSILNPRPLMGWRRFAIGDGKLWAPDRYSDILHYANIVGDGRDDNVFQRESYEPGNTTITHNAPIGHGLTLDNFEIGAPVYMTGNVYKFNSLHRIYQTATGTIDCIASVKNTGDARTYLGICCEKKPKSGFIEEDTIEFATHGDCWVKVSNANDYQIGDTILIDKTILGEDQVITNIIRRMIIGVITAKISNSFVAVMLG